MDTMVSSYTSTLESFDQLIWIAHDALGGIALCLVIAVSIRLLLKACLSSVIGKTPAGILCTIIEVTIIFIIGLKTAENPAVIAVALGWTAAAFRRLVIGSA